MIASTRRSCVCVSYAPGNAPDNWPIVSTCNKSIELWANYWWRRLTLPDQNANFFAVWQTYLAWQESSQDELFESFGDSFIKDLKEYAVSIGADNPFVYLDYAYKTQDPLASYGKKNYEHIKAMAEKYDPLRVFQTMVPGGFKISKAGPPVDDEEGQR